MDLADVWTAPSLFPLRLNSTSDHIVFVPLSETQYRHLAFLDDRYIPVVNTAEVPLADLARSNAAVWRQDNRPVHAIFHIAFCGSTFVARCLDRLSGALVLKEPFLLHDLACRKRHDGTAAKRQDWQRMFDVVMALMSRTYAADQVSIVKPTDASTPLVGDVLAHSSESGALFLHIGLEDFLAAVLRDDIRRGFVRDRLEDLSVLYPDHPVFGAALREGASLTVGERAACLWLLHREIYSDFVAEHPDARVRSLDFALFLERPLACLNAIAALFGVETTSAEIDRAFEAEAAVHSKERGNAFTAADRRSALAEAANQHRVEIDLAFEWAERQQRTAGLPVTLPLPLDLVC
jgi:hypothetical protein